MSNTEIHLENSDLFVSIIPDEGGRVASLREQRSGLEFLTQARTDRELVTPGMTTLFRDGPCAGIEECLPTVAASPDETIGGGAPDHGDFWQLSWKIIGQPSTDRLSIEAVGFSRPFRFHKEFLLEGSSLVIRYRVENLEASPQSFLYACHPLFAVSEGDRVLLPPGVDTLNLNFSRGGRLGRSGAQVNWPRPNRGDSIDLSITQDAAARTSEMFYTDRLLRGHCGLYRTFYRTGLRVSFDIAQLPYLGLWLCYGGWPDSGDEPFQYAVALEPTVAPCNTLQEAQKSGLAKTLAAQESFSWKISFQISRPLSLEEFSKWINMFD